MQACRDHAGKIAEFGELLANASQMLFRKSMVFIENNAPAEA
ncbi:MAG TPA: hypothetical protein VK988_16850 [Acidimicrobiales bacterium]|nr:hypothetical protein [Acidimicrobiales bacterium]